MLPIPLVILILFIILVLNIFLQTGQNIEYHAKSVLLIVGGKHIPAFSFFVWACVSVFVDVITCVNMEHAGGALLSTTRSRRMELLTPNRASSCGSGLSHFLAMGWAEQNLTKFPCQRDASRTRGAGFLAWRCHYECGKAEFRAAALPIVFYSYYFL